MELDYIANINEFGENIVRLYNFDIDHISRFRELIKEVVINKKEKLDLSQIDFIQARNCNLILGLFKSDEGIISPDDKTFYCAMTKEGFENMLQLLEPFSKNKTKSYQYLYDLDNPTGFLLTPAGTWEQD